ncbi:MAG: inositol monophosphatase [bacterium]|nr:inositol monophosphatase [bacterium]
MRLNALDSFIKEIVEEAGESIISKFGKVTSGEQKSARGDIVTVADKASEEILISAIRKKYPYHGIVSEEAGELPGKSPYTWIIDPLDGTSNFAKQVPLFCVIVALAKGNSIQNAAIYDPIHQEFFYARKGVGSYLNGKPISVSNEVELDAMTISISNVQMRSSLEQFAHWRSLTALYTTHYKAYGSAGITLASVASGRSDAYIVGGAYPWDIAAGSLLIREAGGKITDLAGNAWKWREKNQQILTANPKLHRKLVRLISHV